MRNVLLFCDTAISHSNIDIRIVTKNIVVHRCIAAALAIILQESLQIHVESNVSNDTVVDNITHSINPPMVKAMWDLFSPKTVFDKKYPSVPQNAGLSRT